MKFVRILSIAAAAALFTSPVMAGEFEKHGGFNFEAHVGGAASDGKAEGSVEGKHIKDIEVTNDSKTGSYAGHFEGSDCATCGSNHTEEYYAGTQSSNKITVDVGEHQHGGVEVNSVTGAESGAIIGDVSASGYASVGGSSHHGGNH
jgi:hypothetical protein